MFAAFRDGASYLWGFFKPHNVADADLHYRWSVRMTWFMIILTGSLVGHLIVQDVLPWDGTVAKTEATDELDDKLKILLQQSTDTYKIALGQEICRIYFLRADSNGVLYLTLTKAYEEKQHDYAEVNKDKRYDIAECAAPSPG